MNVKLVAAGTLVLTLVACRGPAGAGVVAIGDVHRIDSEALGETRVLNVWTPPAYEASDERLPVIYLLDGSAHEDYHHMTGLVQFLTMYERMPRSIVVGIANVDRYRDFTHASDVADDFEALPTGGGSAAFLRFVADELQPYVERTWRTDGQRMLVGQSMGGLLATEVLVDRPELFDRYVLVSPSLWWGAEALSGRAEQSFAAHDLAGKQVFVTLGDEHPKMHEAADALVAALRRAAPGVRVGYETLRDETHATILHRGFERALAFFYREQYPGL